MIILTQNDIITIASPWWNNLYINKETGLEIFLGKSDTDLTIRLAKLRSKKRTTALYKDICAAIDNEQRLFNINKWLSEYSLKESSKVASKSQ